MATKQVSLDERLDELRRRLTEAGAKVLSGNWGGKGGIARYKDRWLVVIDRNLPPGLKLRLLEAALECLSAEAQKNGREEIGFAD